MRRSIPTERCELKSDGTHTAIVLTAFLIFRYYEGGVSSVFLWDLDDGGFAGVVLLKKGGPLKLMAIDNLLIVSDLPSLEPTAGHESIRLMGLHPRL